MTDRMFLLPPDVGEEWEDEFVWPTTEGAVCEYPDLRPDDNDDELDRVMKEKIAELA